MSKLIQWFKSYPYFTNTVIHSILKGFTVHIGQNACIGQNAGYQNYPKFYLFMTMHQICSLSFTKNYHFLI